MPRKNRVTKLSASDEEFLSKFSTKERQMAVDGKPSRKDRDDLALMFTMYDKYTGGRLTKFIQQNMLERALNKKDKNIQSVYTAERLAFGMPRDLQEYVEQYFPSIWTNHEHLRWFLKQFPMFRR